MDRSLSEEVFREGLGLFPWSQVLKNFFNDIRLVNEADDAHLFLAFGTG
jgi:hypothetical protein